MSKDTREKILEAGLTLFSKKGYIGATTKEIAKKAGVAELTLFRHFSSKEKLFEEMIRIYAFLPKLKILLAELRPLDYRSALEEIAGRFMEILNERRELVSIMHSEMHLYPAKVRDIYQNFIVETWRTLASYFKELQASWLLRDFDPELGARAFLGMFVSYFNAQEFLLKKEARVPEEKIIKEYVGIFIAGTMK